MGVNQLKHFRIYLRLLNGDGDEMKKKIWEPHWTSLPSASNACKELIKCQCNPDIGYRGICKCIKANLSCTRLCKCGGDCDTG